MLDSETLIKKIRGSNRFFDCNVEQMIIWFCAQQLDFVNLLHNRLLFEKKFRILRTSSKIDVAEKIVGHILNNLNKRISILANKELALLLDNALRARGIKFNNQVNRVYSSDELYFIKVAHYLSKKLTYETKSIYFAFAEKDQKIISGYHELFQKINILHELIDINQDLYVYLTGKVFDTNQLKLSHLSSKTQYFEFITESLGDLEHNAEENVIITSINSVIQDVDHCFFTPFSYEEYYQSFRSKFPLVNKRELENKILEAVMINFFSNQEIYVGYDTNIKKKLYWFEIIYELLNDVNDSDNTSQAKDMLLRYYHPPCHYLQHKDLPQEVCVTAIEKLMCDPYLYYTNHILRLKPLQSMEEEELDKLFGIVLHEVFSIVIYKTSLNIEAFINEFSTIVSDILIKHNLNYVVIKSFWLPKFLKIAKWFWHYEQGILPNRLRVFTEVEGWIIIDLGRIKIKLCAKMDRIDLMKDGSVNIIDYKSGILPSNKDIKIGVAPKLPLNALIIKNGYINDELLDIVDEKINLYYLNITGRNYIGEAKMIPVQLENTLLQLTELLRKFWLDDPCFFFQNGNGYLNYQYKHFVRYIEIAAT